MQATNWLLAQGRIRENPVSDFVAAVSAGVRGGELILDLDYEEDSTADLDANFVVSGNGKFIEVQATGEEHPFDAEKMSDLMKLAATGCIKLIDLQKQALE
jgi:ribonuclease PH